MDLTFGMESIQHSFPGERERENFDHISTLSYLISVYFIRSQKDVSCAREGKVPQDAEANKMLLKHVQKRRNNNKRRNNFGHNK